MKVGRVCSTNAEAQVQIPLKPQIKKDSLYWKTKTDF